MRSLIPRLVLHPLVTKPKEPLPSNRPLSEEESKDFDSSSQHSKRTISPNSLSSDDTGCPSSQCASPRKTPSCSDNSPLSSPSLNKTKVKRVQMNVTEERRINAQKHKSQKKQCTVTRIGSDTDFSSSSSNGSYKTHEHQTYSTGKSICFRSHGPVIRTLPPFKPAGSPSTLRDKDLYAIYKTPPNVHSNPTSIISSYSRRKVPVSEQQTGRRSAPVRFHSCGDNHGIKPPNPEQYLTPLQQKEVAVRHLTSRLRESENIISDREGEIEDLKAQMSRMREDWIEEECHRVEAQLALKEARKEIKQLRQVVETMKNSLVEKDKGIQKYFIDINIQNRKLESLLHSMEMAQSGCNLQEEPTLDFMYETLGKSSEMGLQNKYLATKEMAYAELLDEDKLVNDAEILMSTAVDVSKSISHPGISTLESGLSGNTTDETFSRDSCPPENKEIQTDDPCSPDLQAILFQLLKLHDAGLSGFIPPTFTQQSKIPKQENNLTYSQGPIIELPSDVQDGQEQDPISPTSPKTSQINSTLCVLEDKNGPNVIEELENPKTPANMAVVGKSHWSNSFLVDLMAVAAPVLPTVAWLYSQHGLVGGAPVYNIASLIRGCCIMGLHSLRHVSHGSNT